MGDLTSYFTLQQIGVALRDMMHIVHTVFYLFFLLPSAFLSPLRPAIRAELSSNTSGWVVPVFSANLHEIRAYNRLAGMARGAVLLLLQVWGAECMAGMVLGTKLLMQCVGRGMGRTRGG